MVNFAFIPLAAIAVIIPFATADNCRDGYIYCGSSLLKKGNYLGMIKDKLNAQPNLLLRIPPYDNSLWKCVGSEGDIQYITWCGSHGCFDAGWNKNDYCIPD
ncbi:Uncharacterized protein TPAR_05280 [Tolypocladium paradoxum]|uniref:Uncharacterized protein n=1 Tax=Tolypocladium paradoxum TaxID=94208 RepID=A0A2S4KWH2_9HYPO|nr:Uncharacterized protein TPAR_05280 [Tolypocladium paradoxum]